MKREDACQAIYDNKSIEIEYDGFRRVVEVHAVGVNTRENEVMRVYQVSGDSSSGTLGWKILKLDKALFLNSGIEKSCAPRPKYKRDDKAMTRIFCQV